VPSESVLIIDDDEGIRRLFGRILSAADFRTSFAEDGLRGLAMIRQSPPDLVLVDINMPELGGLDVVRAYRFIDPEAAEVPVIMLSADVTPDAIKDCREAGVDAFLPKPIEARRLLDEIAALLAKRSAERS